MTITKFAAVSWEEKRERERNRDREDNVIGNEEIAIHSLYVNGKIPGSTFHY